MYSSRIVAFTSVLSMFRFADSKYSSILETVNLIALPKLNGVASCVEKCSNVSSACVRDCSYWVFRYPQGKKIRLFAQNFLKWSLYT